MSARFFMASSFLMLAATLWAIRCVWPRRRGALLAVLFVSAASSVYTLTRGVMLGRSPSYELAYARECLLAVLVACVAVATWDRAPWSAFVRRFDSQQALITIGVVGALGWAALFLPGKHFDYRGLVPVVLAAGLACAYAVRAADFQREHLDGAACTGLALVCGVQVAHLIAHEWSLLAFAFMGYVYVAVYCWAMAEISVAAYRR